MKVHFYHKYGRVTSCGVHAYETNVTGEYDTQKGYRIEATEIADDVTCKRCLPTANFSKSKDEKSK